MTRTAILRGIAPLLLSGLALLVAVPAANADFDLQSTGVSVSKASGAFSRQAGAHDDVRFDVNVARTISDGPFGPQSEVSGDLRNITIDLPAGVTGDPTAYPTCAPADLAPTQINGGVAPICPTDGQVGIVGIDFDGFDGYEQVRPLYNLQRANDNVGRFGFNVLGNAVVIDASLRPDDYGVRTVTRVPQAATVFGFQVTLWGNPSDPVHDAERSTFNNPVPSPGVDPPVPNRARPTPFLTNATSCPAAAQPFRFAADSWQTPQAVVTRANDADPDGVPLTNQNCDRLRFDPSVSVQALSHDADAPTGLDVDLRVPQNPAPDGLATAHVRRVQVDLPEGMSVSPSAAAGLAGCAPNQIALGDTTPSSCPNQAKLGSVRIDTPLLDVPLQGDVVLASTNDNPFNTLLALYLVVPGPGFELKLPGAIATDPQTGRLTATFENTPQLPFDRLQLHLDGGPRAALATPATCGTYPTTATATSWASDTPVALDAGSLRIDQNCDAAGTAPQTTAGVRSQQAGISSPFDLSVTRQDGAPLLSRIDATLPPGLLARIGSVPLCSDAAAAAGTCGPESLVGSTSVLSGPGSLPLPLTGRVYLTGPYAGQPFGLSIVVPTAGQAGPFDLGDVVVRASIAVDRTDAHVTVRSDPLPTILKGFPLRLRQVVVRIDRDGFMLSPTSCRTGALATQITTGTGTTAQSTPFQLLGCGALSLDQKLALRFTGHATRDGQHPGVTATLTAPATGSNLQAAEVKLPLSVALDPDNAEALCSPEQRAALACPDNTIVGTASATSVLPDPLTGPVYFVQGTRQTASGRTVRTLPKLWIPLSADGVTIDVNADSDVDSLGRLVTTFHDLPDAPISRFALDLEGGRNGILVVSGKPGTCERPKTIDARFTGHNGERVARSSSATVEGCPPRITSVTTSSKAVTVKLAALPAGTVRITGKGLRTTRKTVKSRTATVAAKLSKAGRRAVARRGLRTKLAVRVDPRTGKTRTLRRTVTIERR